MNAAFAFVPVVRGENRLEVKNQNGEHDLILIGAIGKSWWDDTGITEQDVRDALKSIPAGQKINARINSEGGSVKEGLGIYNAFKERRADITAHITGYALSIASVFPLGASKVVSPKSAIWMMHKAWSVNQGNADDMRHAAEMLDAHDDTLIDIYAAETGKPKAEIRTAMENETWIKGGDAVAFGLADETDTDDAQAGYRPLPENYLSRCKAPAEILNALSAAPKQGAAKPNQPQDTIMNKKLVIALLKKHGIEALDTETEEQLQAKMDNIPVAQAIKNSPDKDVEGASKAFRAELDSVKAELAKANEARVTAKIKEYVGAFKITNDEVPIFVKAALADESGTVKILDAKETNNPGGDPVGGNRVYSVSDAPNILGLPGAMITPGVEAICKEHKTVSARHDAIRKDWRELHQDACARDKRRGMDPQASNTYSATLVTSFLVDGSVTDLQNRWAMLKAFSVDFSEDPYKPLATAVIKHVTAGATTQTDATNFESGNSTVAPVSVTMHQYTQSFQVSNADLQSGLRMENLVTINTANFANKIIEVATVPITVAIFTGDTVTSSAAAFGFSDLATLQALLKKSPIKNLILDGAYIARIANSPAFFQTAGVVGGNTSAWKAFGWDIIAQNTDWTGAGANVQGFACNPQAISGITGLPVSVNAPGGIFTTTNSSVPELQCPYTISSWFNPASRTMWTSFDIMAGFKETDATAGFILKSA